MSITSEIVVSILLFRNTKGNVKQMYDLMSKFQPSAVVNVGGGGGGNIGGGNVVGGGGGSQGLKWDKPHCGQGVAFESQNSVVILKEPAYVFRTAVANTGFSSGQHYWEIVPDGRTEN